MATRPENCLQASWGVGGLPYLLVYCFIIWRTDLVNLPTCCLFYFPRILNFPLGKNDSIQRKLLHKVIIVDSTAKNPEKCLQHNGLWRMYTELVCPTSSLLYVLKCIWYTICKSNDLVVLPGVSFFLLIRIDYTALWYFVSQRIEKKDNILCLPYKYRDRFLYISTF